MICATVERTKDGKKTLMDLDLSAGFHNGFDRMFFKIDKKGCHYFQLTEADLIKLYHEKKEMQKERELTWEVQSELEELRAWKAEMSGKSFIQQVLALWRMRK